MAPRARRRRRCQPPPSPSPLRAAAFAAAVVGATAARLGRDARLSVRSRVEVHGQQEEVGPSSYSAGVGTTVLHAAEGHLHGVTASSPNLELLRFVTAYRTGLEAIVDVTPYSALFRAAAASNNLSFYNFIDTWVGNTSEEGLYHNSATGECSMLSQSHGNGWSLSATLIFWQDKAGSAVSTEPREVVNLAPGVYGGDFPMGRISLLQGHAVDNGAGVMVDSTFDVTGQAMATVYECPKGVDEVYDASLIGYVVQQSQLSARAGRGYGLGSLREDISETLMSRSLAQFHVVSVDKATSTVHGFFNASIVDLKPKMPVYFDSSSTHTDRRGFWPNGEVLTVKGSNATVRMFDKCVPTPEQHDLPHLLVPVSSTSMSRIEAALKAAASMGTAKSEASVLGKGPQFLNMSSLASGRSAPCDETSPPHELFRPFHLQGSSLVSMPILGHLDLGKTTLLLNSSKQRISFLQGTPIAALADGRSLCITAQQHQGRLFTRTFGLSHLGKGDRVVFQLSVTGHGWARTLEQCGEFCHAVYQLKLNGRSAANVTQFRDDCKDNPIGQLQFGTWPNSRNGWCPGSVEPGLYVDLTDYAKQGSNTMTVELGVWYNDQQKYAPYTDLQGFIFGDQAKLTVALTGFVYSAESVAAIRAQPRALTAAEAALRQGSSQPEALKPATVLSGFEASSFMEQSEAATVAGSGRLDARRGRRVAAGEKPLGPPRPSRREDEMWPASFLEAAAALQQNASRSKAAAVRTHGQLTDSEATERTVVDAASRSSTATDAEAEAAGVTLAAVREHRQFAAEEAADSSWAAHRFDIEGRAPWYLYDSSTESGFGGTAVQLFNGVLVQSNTRDVQMKLSPSALPATWTQVGLHLKLSKPPGDLDFDHWDREGSFGLRFM